jgi:predicted transposase/invertase (TIGR01784 family)
LTLPEKLRQELLEIKRNTKPGEEKVMISNMGRNLQRYYDEAILKGKQEGIKEGELTGVYKTARRMLAWGVAAEVISDYTGLALDEIEKLRSEAGDNR